MATRPASRWPRGTTTAAATTACSSGGDLTTDSPKPEPEPNTLAPPLSLCRAVPLIPTRWDLSTEQCVDVMEGHEGAVWSVAVQGRTLLSASTGGSVILWDPRVPAKRARAGSRARQD